MALSVPSTSCCFLRISITGEVQLKPVVVALDMERCPKTCASFVKLCSATETTTKQSPQPTFRGCDFHRVVPGFCVQAGDFETFDGTGGYSPLWGKNFEDEDLQHGQHDREGVLSMANYGPNTNGSQFFISLKAVPHLDGKHVVFGRVVAGMDVVHKMCQVDRDGRDRPVSMQRIQIVDCGVGVGDSGMNKDDGVDGTSLDRRRDKKRKKKGKREGKERTRRRKRGHKKDDSSNTNSLVSSSESVEHTRKRKKRRRWSSKDSDDEQSSASGSSSNSSHYRRRKRSKKDRRERHSRKRKKDRKKY